MRIFSQLIALNRSRQLGRQFKEIERSIRALPDRSRARLGTLTLREIGQASRSPFPHLYGTPPEERYLPWGQGTDIGYARACSDNPEVAMRGIALWLAVAYHETKDSPHPSLQPHFRQLMRVVRELKEMHGEDTVGSWMHDSATA
ncbi:hypothetical protein ASG87_17080 [Frateuria sp. Soil773]|uniref:hypothetical protein n=1 Tax=Frateuria sp. Soil773 TaxID=1736407 RepID=UPI0006F612B9|nr:hypothetical protein [Frateuria sp. Soil773]KRE94993.1 hypothetical protein ASG87_17080 [Frateuria sp. Soil773]